MNAEKRNSKVKFALLAILVIFSLLLTACGGSDSVEEVVEEPAQEEVVEQTDEEAPVEQPEETSEEAGVEAGAEQAPAAEVTAGGEYSVDSGFRPANNGFSFQNYGSEAQGPTGNIFPVVNLTPVEMRRMFGDAVCAGEKTEDSCNLTPPAQQWMEQNNAGMAGGHCEGFAVLSQLFYAGILDPNNFGAASVSELQLEGNEALQRELAYWWTTQGPIWGLQRTASANDQIEFLKEQYTQNPNNIFRIGITKEDGTGGHAITAYGVQEQPDGIYWIMVYDNNYPGQERYITVDTNANTWQYEAAINPDVESELYSGGDNNMMFIAPNEERVGTLPCDFCGETGTAGKGAGLADTTEKYNQIWAEGSSKLLLIDDNDKMIGYQDGKFINEIPEAKFIPVLSGSLAEETTPPIFHMPIGKGFTAVIDGNQVDPNESVDVVMIGPGFYIGAEGIQVQPGEIDQLVFDGEGDFITYNTETDTSPIITVGVESEGADYQLDLASVEMEPGTDIHVLFDAKEGYIALSTTSTTVGKYSIAITRIGEEDEETFETDENEPIELQPSDIIYFYFGEWDGQGSLKISYDDGGDGTIDETVDMADAQP